VRARPFAGDRDLAAMQRLMVDARRREGPLVKATPGDLHWWLYQHTNKLDEVRIAVWEHGRRLVGWTWLWLPGALFSFLAADVRNARAFGEQLDWFEAEAARAGATELQADVMDVHGELRGALEARGYSLVADEGMEHMLRPLDDLPAVPPVDGFELRAVRLPEELEARVDVHRAAFAPSRVTPESYGNVVARAPYRQELDWVAVAPDGRHAAFCLVWLDAENGLAEMEPVGTHPDFRRRGLASAVCLAALAEARRLGAREGLVYAVTGDPSVSVYESIGFRSRARHLVYARPREAPAVS
jgi:ribosomal protein S18 acetylase RimI-like enzyme